MKWEWSMAKFKWRNLFCVQDSNKSGAKIGEVSRKCGLGRCGLTARRYRYPQYKTKKRDPGSHLRIQHSPTRKPFYASALDRVYIRRSHPTRKARQFAQILDKSCAVSHIYTNYGLAHLADDSRVGGIYQSIQRRFSSHIP